MSTTRWTSEPCRLCPFRCLPPPLYSPPFHDPHCSSRPHFYLSHFKLMLPPRAHPGPSFSLIRVIPISLLPYLAEAPNPLSHALIKSMPSNTCLSSAIVESAFQCYPHHTTSTSPCPMNKLHVSHCKLLDSQLCHAFFHTPPIPTSSQNFLSSSSSR